MEISTGFVRDLVCSRVYARAGEVLGQWCAGSHLLVDPEGAS